MSKQESENPMATPQDLERVREILFGGAIREHNARFDTLKRDLDRLQKSLDKTNEHLSAQDNAQSKKLKEAQRDFQKGIDELREEMRSALDRMSAEKLDREHMGDLLIEMGNQIKSSSNGMLSSVLDGLLQTNE